jgi:hypothetical protein
LLTLSGTTGSGENAVVEIVDAVRWDFELVISKCVIDGGNTAGRKAFYANGKLKGTIYISGTTI